jgi:hypothetical protein
MIKILNISIHVLLVSCPASGSDQGGLFLPDFKNNGLEKLYTGSCSGMTLVKDRLFVTSDDNQIITMDQRFQVIQKTKHLKLDFHDIVKFNDNVVLVVETAINAIGCYETDTFTPIGEIRFDSADKDVHHINDIWLDLLGVEPIRRAVSARSSNSRGSPAATVTRRRSMSCSTLGYGVTTVRPLAGTTPAPVCHAACCIKNPGSDIADQHKIFGCQREPGTPSVVSPPVLKSSWVNQEEESSPVECTNVKT